MNDDGAHLPLITVVTVVYNDVEHIESTILSVVNQTYNNIEYIIIDGGSTDGTVDVIKKYANHIAYWVSEPDKGIYNAMNKGICKATGEWINFMNSGDTFCSPEVLLEVFSCKMCNVDVIAGIALIEGKKRWVPYGEKDLSLMYFYLWGICHQATFIRRKLFEKEMYDENLRIASDSKFFIKNLIFEHCTYKKVNIEICNFALGGISSNETKQKDEIDLIMHEFLPERVYKDYVYNSVYNTRIYIKFVKPIDKFIVKYIFPFMYKVKHCFFK